MEIQNIYYIFYYFVLLEMVLLDFPKNDYLKIHLKNW